MKIKPIYRIYEGWSKSSRLDLYSE